MKRVRIAFAVLMTLAMVLIGWAPGMGTEPIEVLKFFRSQTGDQTFAIQRSYVNNYVLTPSVNKAVTVPEGAFYAVFSADADIWVALPAMHGDAGTTAEIPSLDVTDGTGCELNPVIRRVDPSSIFGVISASAAKLSIMFFK